MATPLRNVSELSTDKDNHDSIVYAAILARHPPIKQS